MLQTKEHRGKKERSKPRNKLFIKENKLRVTGGGGGVGGGMGEIAIRDEGGHL